MTAGVKLTGTCLCGAVRISGVARAPEVAVCHCDMCRRWSSGPYFEVTCGDVAFEGAENITRFRSSDWAERGFCGKCGSNLFYHLIDSAEFQMAAGLIDDPPDLSLALQVFIDRKPGYYTLAEKTETMTAEDVFAAYAPPQD